MNGILNTIRNKREGLRGSPVDPVIIALNRRRLWLKGKITDVCYGTLAKLNRTAIYRHNDINLKFVVTSGVEYRRVRNRGQEFTRTALETRLPKSGVFYDIGANIGIFTLPAAQIVGKDGRVVAFEAAPANYNRLLENLEQNNLTNVIPFGLGLSSENTTATLFRPTNRLGEGGHSLLDNGVPSAGVSTILLARLDDLVELWDLPTPDLVKIDVEGAEMDVLAGMAKLLDNPALKSIVCEVKVAGPRADPELVTEFAITSFLGEHGFVEEMRSPAGSGEYYDIMFNRDRGNS
jgi:FkbM family methyltransferase